MSNEVESPTKTPKKSRRSIPARTEEGREQQLTNLAMNLAEKKLRDGTASSQIICHFLDLVTEKTKLEREKMQADVKLREAQVDALESQKTSEELYAKVLTALKRYKGLSDDD